VAPGGEAGALNIHQDARLYASILESGERVEHALAPGRGAWLQVARGKVTLNSVTLERGDGAAIEDERSLAIEASEAAEILLFDLA
jgi:redox-sensitive bicupin YhaK (pirin superfamily)